MKRLALFLVLAACGPTPVQTCTFDADARDAAVARPWVELENWVRVMRIDEERVAMRRYVNALKEAYATDPGLTCEVAPR